MFYYAQVPSLILKYKDAEETIGTWDLFDGRSGGGPDLFNLKLCVTLKL